MNEYSYFVVKINNYTGGVEYMERLDKDMKNFNDIKDVYEKLNINENTNQNINDEKLLYKKISFYDLSKTSYVDDNTGGRLDGELD